MMILGIVLGVLLLYAVHIVSYNLGRHHGFSEFQRNASKEFLFVRRDSVMKLKTMPFDTEGDRLNQLDVH